MIMRTTESDPEDTERLVGHQPAERTAGSVRNVVGVGAWLKRRQESSGRTAEGFQMAPRARSTLGLTCKPAPPGSTASEVFRPWSSGRSLAGRQPWRASASQIASASLRRYQ